jgi:hypothetical protein
MVWVAFFNKTKGTLVFLPPQQQTTKDFVENVYQPHLIPFLQKNNPNQQLTSMEDNAPVHTALASRKFKKDNNIRKIDDWPPQSPDLNPIENVWKVLKTNVQELYKPWTVEIMKQTLQLAWALFSEQTLENVVESMPRRMKAVHNAKGKPTRW